MRTLACVAVLAAAAYADPAGAWEVELVREGWQPRVAKAVLVLAKKGKRWQGTITFRRILYAKPHDLADVEVKGKRVVFHVEHPEFQLAFRGKADGKELRGECEWKGVGRFPWTAAREGGAPVALVEKGLKPRDLPVADPAALDRAALERLVRAAADAHTTSLVVLENGKIVCERHFGSRRPRRVHVMSVTKWLTAMATALLIEEKKIPSLDAPVSTWFPEWKEGRKAQVTLRHLLAHTSGIRDPGDARALNREKDKVAYVRGLPVDDEPGRKFRYNNNAVALLSGILAQAAGQRLDQYVAARIFKPLGIRDWKWDRDGAGHTLAYANLQLTARDLAKIGLLVAQGGRWEGRQVFPEKWIATLGAPGRVQPNCGLLWWNHEGKAYYHTGWLGQWLVVFPGRNVVGVRLRAWDGNETDPDRELGAFLGLLDGALARD